MPKAAKSAPKTAEKAPETVAKAAEIPAETTPKAAKSDKVKVKVLRSHPSLGYFAGGTADR